MWDVGRGRDVERERGGGIRSLWLASVDDGEKKTSVPKTVWWQLSLRGAEMLPVF